MSDLKNAAAQQLNLDWLLADLERFPANKRDHFFYVLHALLDCSKSDQKKALVLIQDDIVDPHQLRMLAVNATTDDTEEMLETLCRLKGFSNASGGSEPH